MADPGPASSSSPKDKLVLVIDDDNNIRAILTMCLSMAGFQVATAVDGLDAAAQIEKNAPHLIITDLKMPGQGGYDFLRSLTGAGRIPIFIMTGSTLESSTVDLLMRESGAREFFKKPIQTAQLIAAAHRHLKTVPV